MSELTFGVKDGEERPRAVVLAVQLPGVNDAELDSSLVELERLARTLGLDVVGRVKQRRKGLASGTVVGEGKLVELARWTGGKGVVEGYKKPGTEPEEEAEQQETGDGQPATGNRNPEEPRATVVLVDHDLTPTQQRNLEIATGVEVHDRTSVILGIFFRHARTREARLQVEMARLAYLAPRLKAASGGEDRQRGGIGGKGAGESTLELDRRRIRDRIAELRRELEAIEGGAKTRRGRRSELPTVALVGYTNAGKSSLMRALTGSEVYVADKLFATLDTTVRVLLPRTEPPILVSDTVGFIKKLPHDLVASFRSTLEEAAEADLLLHVVDAADAAHEDHIAVTNAALGEIGADATAWILLNKIDKVDEAGREALRDTHPDAIQLSARDEHDTEALAERLTTHFLGAPEEAELVIPWDRHKLVHEIHEHARVVAETHEESGTRLTVRAPRSVIEKLRAQLDPGEPRSGSPKDNSGSGG